MNTSSETKAAKEIGSCKADLLPGETCIVNGIAHYEYDLSAVDSVPVGLHEGYGEVVLRPNEKLLSICATEHPEIKHVICASGNRFLRQKEKEEYGRIFNADVCDMESAG